MDLIEAFKDIIDPFDIKINESRPWNFKSGGAAYFCETSLVMSLKCKNNFGFLKQKLKYFKTPR